MVRTLATHHVRKLGFFRIFMMQFLHMVYHLLLNFYPSPDRGSGEFHGAVHPVAVSPFSDAMSEVHIVSIFQLKKFWFLLC
jgi:hypothetical protein